MNIAKLKLKSKSKIATLRQKEEQLNVKPQDEVAQADGQHSDDII